MSDRVAATLHPSRHFAKLFEAKRTRRALFKPLLEAFRMVDMLTRELDHGSRGGVRHHLKVSELPLTGPRCHITIIIHLHAGC